MRKDASESSRLCVIASTRPWNRELQTNLTKRSKCRFELIDNPKHLNLKRLLALNPRYVFFPHWSHRIDASIFTKYECVIFHMTDLPFGRGGSPLQNLIVRGIYETKISALRCGEEMDAGPIYMKRSLSLHGAAEEIYLRASKIIEEMIVEILDIQPKPVAQEGQPTVFKRRTPEEGNLASLKSLQDIFDRIRMLDANGYPSAFIEIGAYRLEFSRASLKSDQVLADVRIEVKKKEP